MEPLEGLNSFKFATGNPFVTGIGCVSIMDDNYLSNSFIISVSLIEAKRPLRSPLWRGVEPSSRRGDSFALGVPGVAVFLESEFAWFEIVPTLSGGVSATGAFVNVNAAASDHASDAGAQFRYIHFERSPSFRQYIEANRDSSFHAGISKSASNIIRVGRFHVGLEAFHAPKVSGTKGLDQIIVWR